MYFYFRAYSHMQFDFRGKIEYLWGSPGSTVVKDSPAMQETPIRSLGQKNPLEKEMATHCSILAWEIPWTEEPGGLES